ncbi:MAG: methyl-accepting chemotaxis protein [Nitrospirae bacterium]|nr:methyl-accepting chemotaxis protein [Nitrospirota bacterium]
MSFGCPVRYNTGQINFRGEIQFKESEQMGSASVALVDKAILWTLILMVLCLVSGLAFAFFMSDIISRPLKDLTAQAELIAGGDLNVCRAYTTTDEIGLLGAAFCKMAANLQDVISQMILTVSKVITVADRIRNNGDETRLKTQRQAEQADAIAAAAVEMNQTIADISLNTTTAPSLVPSFETCKVCEWMKAVERKYGGVEDFSKVRNLHLKYHDVATNAIKSSNSGDKAGAMRLLNEQEQLLTEIDGLFESLKDRSSAYA